VTPPTSTNRGDTSDINQSTDKTSQLVSRYKKMVAQYFITIRNVKDYAEKLSITSNHLQKIIKQETGKSAGEFIDDMLLMEIKALLRYTQLNISEIAHQLEFTDASHLAKFFKKYTGLSPVAYRKKHS
jgi:AraC-like DNA-binding protein